MNSCTRSWMVRKDTLWHRKKEKKNKNQRHKVAASASCASFTTGQPRVSCSAHLNMTIMWVLGIGQEGGVGGGGERQCLCLSPLSLGHSFVSFFLSKLLCVCAFRPHSLWRSSSRCGRRNRSALRWPRSPPRWRRGRRCAAGRTPLCKDGEKENSRKRERKKESSVARILPEAKTTDWNSCYARINK